MQSRVWTSQSTGKVQYTFAEALEVRPFPSHQLSLANTFVTPEMAVCSTPLSVWRWVFRLEPIHSFLFTIKVEQKAKERLNRLPPSIMKPVLQHIHKSTESLEPLITSALALCRQHFFPGEIVQYKPPMTLKR
jgi:hypothetical protein